MTEENKQANNIAMWDYFKWNLLSLPQRVSHTAKMLVNGSRLSEAVGYSRSDQQVCAITPICLTGLARY